MFRFLLYRRAVLSRLVRFVDLLMFELLFAGGVIFWLAELVYNATFDRLQRMRRTKAREQLDAQLGEAPDWENARVVGRNRRAAHAPLHAFASKVLALEYWLKEYPAPELSQLTDANLLLLTGRAGTPTHTGWYFSLVGDPGQAPEQWRSASFSETGHSEWTPVALPAHWQLQGHDIPIYTNTTYPFAFDPPRARRQGQWRVAECDVGLGASPAGSAPPHPKEPPGENPTGLYRKRFTLPADWLVGEAEGEGDRVFLVFEGADAALSVWLDGAFVGYSQDSCLPAEFDVTALLRRQEGTSGPREHCLAVQVLRWCDGSYLEDQDKWWLSGLYREVLLLRKPRVFISDFEFSADVSSAAILQKAATRLSAEDLHLKDLEARVLRTIRKEAREEREGRALAGAEAGAEAGGKRDPEPPTKAETDEKEAATSGAVTLSVAVEGRPKDGEEWWVRADLHLTGTHGEVGSAGGEAPPILTLAGPVRFPGVLARRAHADAVCDPRESDPGPEETEADPRDKQGVCTLTAILPRPLLWSDEAPHLYTCVLSLHAGEELAERDAPPTDTESFRCGFRDVRLLSPHNAIGLNGAVLTIAGVNRHEFCPQQGRAVSLEAMRRDACLLRQLNFNAVRCSHYPPHPQWLDVCDEAGLLVVDEANVETHGFQALGQAVGYLSGLPEWRGALVSRVSRMVERDKNHASVLFWSLGNEAGVGPAQEAMAAWVRTRDPRRMLQYESGGARTAVTDVICPMYQRPLWCRWQAQEDPQQRPVVLCEYAHAMGNSGGCLAAYWRDFRDPGLPRLQGGFIWDLVDQGLALPKGAEEQGEAPQRFGYGGDFGDEPNTGNFCCNGLLAPDRSPHPSANEAWFLQSTVSLSLRQFQAVGSEGEKGDQRPVLSLDNLCLAVENRRAQADLAGVDVLVALRCDLSPAQAVAAPAPLPLDPRVPLSLPAYPLCRLRGEDLQLGPGAIQGVPLSSVVPALALLLACSAEPPMAEAEAGAKALAAALSTPLGLLPRLAECWIDVAAVRREGNATCPQNSEIFRTSLAHPVLNEAVTAFLRTWAARAETATPPPPVSLLSRPPVSFVEPMDPDLLAPGESALEEVIRIEWADGVFARVGVRCGRLLSWEAGGRALLTEPLDSCLWRAPTDNDRGGGFLSYATQWATYGLGSLRRSGAEDPRACSLASCSAQPDGSVVVEADWTLEPAAVAASTPKPLHCEVRCQTVYTFLPSGAIHVSASVTAPSHLPPLPRVGLSLAVPADLHQVEWLGLGPFEGYADRKACCRLGRFSAPVDALHTPYILPQECGHRLAPRWVALTDPLAGNAGLCVVPCCSRAKRNDTAALAPWGFSASRYSSEQMHQAAHQHELPAPAQCPSVWLHVDSAHMGVGGYDSWTPNVDASALIECGPERCTDVLLVPLHGQTLCPLEAYHRFLRGDFGPLEDVNESIL